MPRIDEKELQARLDALTAKSYKLNDEEARIDKINAQIVEQQRRLDTEMEERLRAECEAAEADLILSGHKGPHAAMYDINAWKATGADENAIGWAIVGPSDSAQVTNYLKAQETYDPAGGKGLQIMVSDPIKLEQIVSLALLRSPLCPHGDMTKEQRAETAKRLVGTGGPRHALFFLQKLHQAARDLAGAEAKTLAGK